MSLKIKTIGIVTSQQEIVPGIFDLWLQTRLAEDASAGQFVGVCPRSESTLLPRPISICEVDTENGRIRLVYRVAGKGTGEFSRYQEGEEVALLGMLGNGFPVEETVGKKVFLMGGGIGIPPMLQLAKEIIRDVEQCELHIIVGYRDSLVFLKEDLEKYGELHIATEDGSVGVKGNVLDVMREGAFEGDMIMACGPLPMLRAIKQFATANAMKAYISLEERMACGVGACLGCVCKTKEIDSHSHVNYARVCTEGPVFDAEEVEI